MVNLFHIVTSIFCTTYQVFSTLVSQRRINAQNMVGYIETDECKLEIDDYNLAQIKWFEPNE